VPSSPEEGGDCLVTDPENPKLEHDPARATVRHALFGGTGCVRVWELGAAEPPFTAVLLCELDPGGRVGEHRQETDHEIVVFVSGEAVAYVDGRAHAAIAGSAVPLPLGSTLSIDNASPDHPVRYVIVKARR
jgi:quercetin dioxygenase-like cupin family protein